MKIGAAIVGSVTLAALPALAAGASNSGNGTASASIVGGSLSVGSIGSMTALAPTIGGTSTGALPSAQWADGTGLGLGWNGTLAVSPLSYTGSWVASGGPAIATSPGIYTGTDNGRFYTVTVTGTPTAVNTPYSWTSDAGGDSAGGSGTAVNGTPSTIGTHGISISFAAATTYTAGSSYTVLVGTQSASALVVDTATAGSITPSTGTTSTAPTYLNNGTTLSGGSTVGTVNSGGAVKILDAAIGTGASGTGYYTAAPGVQMTADANSWAKTYTASLTYTIISGP